MREREKVCTSSFCPHLQTFDIVFECSLVEVVDEVSLVVAVLLKPLLQGIEHDPTQLLDIMLLPGWREGGRGREGEGGGGREGGREGEREGGREGDEGREREGDEGTDQSYFTYTYSLSSHLHCCPNQNSS